MHRQTAAAMGLALMLAACAPPGTHYEVFGFTPVPDHPETVQREAPEPISSPRPAYLPEWYCDAMVDGIGRGVAMKQDDVPLAYALQALSDSPDNPDRPPQARRLERQYFMLAYNYPAGLGFDAIFRAGGGEPLRGVPIAIPADVGRSGTVLLAARTR